MSVGAVNKSTGDRIPTAGMPAIDAALSGSSTNPVQNKVVKEAFDAIKDGQSIDSFADVETALGEKADADIVASDFSAAASYTAGDYCIYEGKFYKFKTAHSGAWAAADVDEIKIAGELSSLMSGLTGLIAEVVTSEPVAASGSVTVPYPSGFTFSNTAAVSVYITDSNAKYVGDEFAKATLTTGNIALQNKMTTAAYVVGVVLAKVS